MSQASYFSKFPVINYSNTTVTDITKRSVVLNSVYSNPFNFYPYELNSSVRPDTLSQQYYKDQFYSWIIYLSNQTIDPYYQWYMDADTFDNFIVSKYGTIQHAQTYIKYYQVNWRNNPEIIDSSYFTVLDPNTKKYWDLNTNQNSNIISYKRAQLNWTANTNYILQFDISGNFTDNEVLYFYQNGQLIGTGQYSNGTIFNINFNSGFIDLTQPIFNYISLSGDCNVVGDLSGEISQITQYQILSLNIPLEEYSYWEAVSLYDYESYKNEYYKNIILLDSNYTQLINTNLQQLANT